jgi:chemotaxis protein MotB
MSKRRNKGGGHGPNHERWLITYSDLITLLMIFFVIMFAMSKIDQPKFLALAISLNQALYNENKIPMKHMGPQGLLTVTSPTPKVSTQRELTPQQIEEANRLEKIKQELQDYIQKNNLAGKISVVENPKGLQISLRDAVLFDSGQATLTSSAQGVLNGMVPFLKGIPNDIAVEGYTDNVPIHNSLFASNWELSSARALQVVHFFIDHGLDPHKLSATGFGEWRPVAPNDNDADRALNRRVNIVILRTTPYPDGNGSGASP